MLELKAADTVVSVLCHDPKAVSPPENDYDNENEKIGESGRDAHAPLIRSRQPKMDSDPDIDPDLDLERGHELKRIGNLYHKIAGEENLKLAFHKASRGKRGVDEVIVFRNGLDDNLRRLRWQLLEGGLELGNYHFFHVFDPKKRLICAASFPERVLHHAIMNVVEPVFERYAIFDSYACRVGKGNRKALARCQAFARRYPWYLKLDIRQYFSNIDHSALAGILSRLLKDRELLELFDLILATYNSGQPGKGLPIGNLVSQHLANLYLGTLDHWIKEERRIRGYLRYMDDFVLFADDRTPLKEELRQIKNFLADRLKLSLKSNIQLNRTSLGCPFLGFRIFPGYIRLLPQSRRRFIMKHREYTDRLRRGEWDEATAARHFEPLVEFTRIKTKDKRV